MIFIVRHWRLLGFALAVSLLLGALVLQARASDRWERRHAAEAKAHDATRAELALQKELAAAFEDEAARQQAAADQARRQAATLRKTAGAERQRLSRLAPGACETPKEIMELYR